MICNTNAYWAPLLRPLFDAMEDAKNSTNFGTLSMKTDIIEDENAYTLIVDLPGIAKENVSLAYEDNTLTLKVKTVAEEGEIKFVRRERFAGEASRSFYIEGIDENDDFESFGGVEEDPRSDLRGMDIMDMDFDTFTDGKETGRWTKDGQHSGKWETFGEEETVDFEDDKS